MLVNIISSVTSDACFLGANNEKIIVKGKKGELFPAQNIIEEKHLEYLKKDESFLRSLQHGFYQIEKRELTENERLKKEEMRDASSPLKETETPNGTVFAKGESPCEPGIIQDSGAKSFFVENAEKDDEEELIFELGRDFEVVKAFGRRRIIAVGAVQIEIDLNEIKDGFLAPKTAKRLKTAIEQA